MIDANKIADSLGIRLADETMDRLLFRVLQNMKCLSRLSFFGLFATSPPFAVMKLTWPFILDHLPNLESISFCEPRHFLPISRPRDVAGISEKRRRLREADDDFVDCRICHGS